MPSEGTSRDEAKRGGGRCAENKPSDMRPDVAISDPEKLLILPRLPKEIMGVLPAETQESVVLSVDKNTSDVSTLKKGDCYPLDQARAPQSVENFCEKVSFNGSFLSRQ